MFTGIVTDVGEVMAVEARAGCRLTIATAYDPDSLAIGASVACAGTCLTVTARGRTGGRGWFTVDVSEETLRRTALGEWRVGSKVNLERPLKVGDELGGHIVAGHVDGLAVIEAIVPEGQSLAYTFRLPDGLAHYVASKGSITLDGVSLTVNDVEGTRFTVNVVPHTRAVTTFGARAVGDRVNVEVDVLARYLARLSERESAT